MNNRFPLLSTTQKGCWLALKQGLAIILPANMRDSSGGSRDLQGF